MMSRINNNNIYRLLLLLYFAAVAYLCFGHFENTESISPDIFGIPTDKLVHFCMFLPFIPLCCSSFKWRTDGKWRSVALLTGMFFVGSFLAGIIEILQGVLTTYRSADSMDLVADMVGLATSGLGWLIADICKHNRQS